MDCPDCSPCDLSAFSKPKGQCRTVFRTIAEMSDGFSESTKKVHSPHLNLLYLCIVNQFGTRLTALFDILVQWTAGVIISPPKLGGARGGLNRQILRRILRRFRPPQTPPNLGGEERTHYLLITIAERIYKMTEIQNLQAMLFINYNSRKDLQNDRNSEFTGDGCAAHDIAGDCESDW